MSDTVKLRNGSRESRVMVDTTMKILAGLLVDEPALLAQLNRFCKGESCIQPALKELSEMGLINGSSPDDYDASQSVRNIVLSSVTGTMFDPRLIDPVQND